MPEQPNGPFQDVNLGKQDVNLGKVAQDFRDMAGKVGADAVGKVESVAEDTKKAGLEQVQQLTGTAQKVADDLQAQAPMLADYIRDAAKQVERMGENLRERSVGDLLQSATEYGRQQPMLFFAGAAIMGFALARFVKSGMPPSGTGDSASPEDRDAVTNATGINV
jgi:hypothetical protein